MTNTTGYDIQDDRPPLVEKLQGLALRGLRRMYLPDERLFAFCIRRNRTADRVEGVSRRYTAVALIGLGGIAQSIARSVFLGTDIHDVCTGLIDHLDSTDDLGEVALTLWAARATKHPGLYKALRRLRAMRPERRSYPTVELAWSLTALSVGGDGLVDRELSGAIFRRLVESFVPKSALFPHWPVGARGSWARAHLSCFADLVYSIQGLSHYHRATGNYEAIDVARKCAKKVSHLQGPQGQWWWWYDVRTGCVVERFPVYSVHQDSMAPMAFSALRDACGEDYSTSILLGMEWLQYAPEIDGSLIDEKTDLIWRKVARHEPPKATRIVQGAATRMHPKLRAPGLNLVFRPGYVDYETRPYHMGWILHAWPDSPEWRSAKSVEDRGCLTQSSSYNKLKRA